MIALLQFLVSVSKQYANFFSLMVYNKKLTVMGINYLKRSLTTIKIKQLCGSLIDNNQGIKHLNLVDATEDTTKM